VVIVYLALAAVLEVSGDYLMRMGLGGWRWGLIAGALALAGYGLLVNQPAWGFGRTLGLYIAIFFVVSQIIAFLAAGERPSPSLWLGGALVVAGGLVIHLGRP
jgi:drug/metabolite transporter superfamily protein YnfA